METLIGREQLFHTEALILKCMDTLLYSSAIFTKGNNFCGFLLASLDDIAHPKMKEFAPRREKSDFFFL